MDRKRIEALEAIRAGRRPARSGDAADLRRLEALEALVRRAFLRTAPRRPAPVPAAWLAVAAALIAALFLLRGPPEVLPRDWAPFTRLVEGRGEAWVPGRDPEALGRALLAAGAPPGLARVADYRDEGLRLEGAIVGPERVAVAWRDPAGRRVLCEMTRAHLSHLAPRRVLRPPRPGAPALLLLGGRRWTAVTWREGGLTCMLAGELPAEELLALARRAVWGRA